MSGDGVSQTQTHAQDLASSPIETMFLNHTLSPSLRRISRYIVENAADVAYFNSSQVAEAVGVSQASVTRLANSVGLSGYSELQKLIRERLQSAAPVHGQRLTKFQLAVQTEINNLTMLRDSLPSRSDINAIAELIIGSPCLVVMGQRMTAQLANYFAYNAAKILPDVRTLTTYGSPASDTLVQAKQNGGTEIVLFLSPRLPVELINNLKLAKHLGFRVHAIADPDLPPKVAKYCDHILLTPAGKGLVFDTHATHMITGNILLEAITDAAPNATQSRFTFYEDVLNSRKAFITD